MYAQLISNYFKGCIYELQGSLDENTSWSPCKDSCHLWSRWWSVLLLDRYGDIIVPSTIFFPVIQAKAFKIVSR